MYGAGRSSPDSALASDIFDKFCSAVTFKSILSLYRQLCDVLRLKPTYFPLFYPKLKSKLRSWKAQALWSKFDKRAAHRCYNRGKPCSNTRVLIIGGGPCGLRTAIEAQLLGAKVVVVEKRDRFSRNNVLHLWPFVIHDLRALGAKKFFGKFCAGSIDHISIRQLQCILLKVALLLGVEIHENVAFENLIPPSEDQTIKTGWKAKVSPADHPVSQYEFDVLIGADGKRNTLEGFKRKEFRGRLAIAITANFVNRKTEAEARVEEISGVAFIFNQKFFRELNCATGIDLENIVYYKDETHYFVMTAKKHSLLNKGVIIKDYPDTVKLLSPENVNKEALMDYAREAADFSTNYQLPHLDFAVNHYGQPDVAMFDFTSMFAAENASRVLERNGHKLLMCLVGDSLLEPFWPTGSGCARGWLSSFDSCWAIHSWSSGKMTPLEVLAERESIYRLLAQTTPENLNKDHAAYTVEPHTRYPNLNTRAVLDFQVKALYDTDNPAELAMPVKAPVEEATRKRTKRPDSFIHPDTLLTWLKKQVALYDVTITDVTTSFQNGLALCAIIHRYRPDLIDFAALDPANVAGNNQLAFDILEELGVPPVTTGYEMAQSDVPDKLAMLSYLTQVHELFRGEIPCVKKPKGELESEEEILAASISSTSTRKMPATQQRTRPSSSSKRRTLERSGDSSRDSTLARTSKADTSLRKARKRRSTDRPQQPTSTDRMKAKEDIEANRLERKHKAAAFLRRQFDRSMVMLQANDLSAGGFSHEAESDIKEDRNLHDISMFLYRLESDFEDKKRRLEKMLTGFERPDRSLGKGARSTEGSESLSNKVRDLEAKFRGNRPVDKKPKEMIRAIGKLDKTDWQLSALEKKIEENQAQGTSKDQHASKVPKWSRDAFADKFEAINRRIHGLAPDPNEEKFANLERGMKQLERKLKEGSVLETGMRGNNKVAAMAEQLAKKVPMKPDTTVALDRPRAVLNLPQTGGSEACHFCGKRVYLMERLSAEGRFFHRGCFRCEYCATTLRLGGYAFARDDVLGCVFFCTPHVGMVYYLRNKALNRRVSETQIDGALPDNEAVNQTVVRAVEKSEPTVEPMKSPLVQAAVAEEFHRDGTPERVEFENSLSHDRAAQDEHLSEIDEDEWTDRNFGNSVHTDSEDEVSSLDSNDDDDDDEEADVDENFMELDHPLTADETRRLVESWNKRYSTEALSEDSPEQCEGDNDLRIDVPAFPIERKKSSEEGASSDTEMGSEEESSDYENDEEDDQEEEEGEEEEETDQDEEDEMDSATEIETDSEFDQDVDVRVQDIPTIVVNESEAEQMKRSLDHLANGSEEKIPASCPKPEYVDQYISLEPARPLQRTSSNDSRKPLNINPTPAPYTGTGLLAYLRRSELLEKSPSAVDMMGSSFDLKKKYLVDYGGSLAQKSASTTNLDSKLKSFVDTISEAQKMLNPAPQPSVPMQVFLQNTGNIFQQPRSVPNLLPIGKEEEEEGAKDDMQRESTPDEEPPTPTNVHPPELEETPVEDISAKQESSASDESDDEGSSTGGQNTSGDSETESSIVPSEAPIEIELPSVKVEEQEQKSAVQVITLGEAPGESADFDEAPVDVAPKPQLAVQEDFDLSPCNEQLEDSVVSRPLIRSKSRESVDSGNLGLTETELSDWADNSMAGELDLDTEPIKLPKETLPPPELPKSKPPVLANGPSAQLDDIEFADDDEEVLSDEQVKIEMKKEAPVSQNTPVKPQAPDVSEVPKSPALSLAARPKDFASPLPSRQAPIIAPVKEVQLEMQRRNLLDKKCESSPNLLRKKEAISQERETQRDLVRDLVFSRIPRTSPEKLRERRSSYGSVSPSGSSRNSRCESEPRSVTSPIPLFASSQSNLRSVAEVSDPPAEPPPPPPRTPIKSLNATEFKTPSVLRPLERQESARKEARAKAQAMDDKDLGLSPPDYIENLKEKLRRKPSVNDDEIATPRKPSFSEPATQVSRSLAASPTSPPIEVAKSASAPQAFRPPSPKSDVIGSLFLQQTQNDATPASPPQSPRSSSSSKSTSYLWTGLSPSESQSAVEVESPQSTSTPTGAKPKKSKDRERRKSLIQTIAGLFGKKEEQPSKESPVIEEVKKTKDVKSSPTGFRLPKFSPRKDKSPRARDKSTDDSLDGTRSRAASSPVSPASDSRDSTKLRSSSLLASPEASNSKAETSSGSPWSSAFSLSSSKRQSKQAKQAARQAELKRLRMAQSIQRQLEEIEVKQKELEEQGVRLEKALRGEDGGASGRDEPALMQEWFQLVHEKNALSRYEQELMVRARELELEDIHARLQQELKDRMSLDETKKSTADVDREGAILSEMLEIVEQRDSLRSMLEEDRQRYREEDKDLETQMLAKGLRLATLRQRKESQV